MSPRNCIYLIVLIALSASCTHYHPVSLGQGTPSDQEIVSCTAYILGFPYDRSYSRIDTILRQNGLTHEDVASVDQRVWPYLVGIYMSSCTVITLNEEGAKKEISSTEMVRIPEVDKSSKSETGKELTEEEKKEAARLACEKSKDTMRFRGRTIRCLNDCQLHHPLNQKACEDTYSRKFGNSN